MPLSRMIICSLNKLGAVNRRNGEWCIQAELISKIKFKLRYRKTIDVQQYVFYVQRVSVT